MSKTASRTGARVLLSLLLTKRVTASRLEAIARPWYFFFFKLAGCPSLKTPARRLLDVTVTRRTFASNNIGNERGSPQVKPISNALGKTGRCLVGVVLFARLDFAVFVGTLPSRERPGPRLPNRDVWVRTVRKPRPPFAKSFDQTSCLWSSRSLPPSFSFLFFFFFHFYIFLETGKAKTPLPQTAMPVFWQMRKFTDGP